MTTDQRMWVFGCAADRLYQRAAAERKVADVATSAAAWLLARGGQLSAIHAAMAEAIEHVEIARRFEQLAANYRWVELNAYDYGRPRQRTIAPGL